MHRAPSRTADEGPASAGRVRSDKPGHAVQRGVVYTCIVGDYDPIAPHAYVDPDWDYVCFTDNPPADPTEYFWRFRPLRFTQRDDYRNARWHKLHPHRLFPEYSRSLWVDGNVDILGSAIFDDVRRAREAGAVLAIGPHFERTKSIRQIRCVCEPWKG